MDGGGRHVAKLDWFAGLAVAAVATVAVVDAVRRDGSPQRAGTTELEGRSELAEQLGQLGVRGELVLYGDACDGVRLALPSLARRAYNGPCVPRGAESPDGQLVARCAGDATEVFYTVDGGLHSRFVEGCVPAWRPDGVLTLVHDREVVRFRACPGPASCPVKLIPRLELERAARRHPTGPARAPLRVLVDGVVWLSNRRAAVLMSIRLTGGFEGMGPMAGIAFFENGRLTETQPYFRTRSGRLDVSPGGGYVTLTPDVILRADGTQVNLPQHLRAARSFAWSPDESFLAIATRYAVVIIGVGSLEGYDATGGGLRSVTIPQPAARIEWR